MFQLRRPLDAEAGQAFEKAAKIQTNNLKEPDDAANTLVDAFKAYRQTDPQAAVRCLDVAINQYCTRGNFRRAAGHKEALGELYETELGDSKAAIECYEAAASWYEGDNATAYVSWVLSFRGFLAVFLSLPPQLFSSSSQ